MSSEIRFKQEIVLFLMGYISLTSDVYAGGGISTDGSLGQPARIISVPNSLANVEIIQNEGVTLGRNLFHSFAKFNIESGQTVTFTENTIDALDNVISRVTGGTRSDINGTLRSTPGGRANFYLINPSGVIFGQNASIDVPATFHVSTADELNFKNGGRFSASQPARSILSAAEPAAFGFLGTSTTNNGFIGFDHSNIAVKAGQNFDVTSGQIRLSSTFLNGSNIRMVAVKGKSTVNSEKHLPLPKPMPSSSSSGDIKIGNASGVFAGGIDGNGRIALWSNNTYLTDSRVDAYGNGTIDKTRVIEIKSNRFKTENSYITFINEGNILLNGNIIDILNKSIFGASEIVLNAKNVNLINSGTIVGNEVGVTADNVDIDRGQINSNNIFIQAKENLILRNGGMILNALPEEDKIIPKSIKIEAKNVNLDQGKIQSDTFSGIAGNINVNASNNLNLTNNSEISSRAYAHTPGSSGDVDLSANNINLDNSIITTSAAGSGDTGDVRIKTVGELANLGAPQFDRYFLSIEYCSLGSGSSLRRLGKGGLQPKASDAWVY